MADPENTQDWQQRGRDDARYGNRSNPESWEARQAYAAGRTAEESAQASTRASKTFFDNLFGGAGAADDGARINLREAGTGFGLWLLVYFAPLAIFAGAAAQMLVNMATGNSLLALLGAVVGFGLGYLIVGVAFVRSGGFRRIYAIAFAAVPALVCLWAWISGGGGSSPFWQWLLLIGGIAAVLGLASWLTLRHVQRMAAQ